ncbi:MAG: hypothetical protein ACRDJH_22665 [Thermomicrobiales bacterium]
MHEQHDLEQSDGTDKRDQSVPEAQLTEDVGDWVLANLLDCWSATGISMDITVQCGGVLVAGSPIPEHLYFERLGQTIGEATAAGPIRSRDDEAMPADVDMSEVVKRFGQALQSALTEIGLELHEGVMTRFFSQDAENPLSPVGLGPRPRSFVNLERATMWNGHGNEIDIPLWRGRLADVSSWYLGRHGISRYGDE